MQTSLPQPFVEQPLTPRLPLLVALVSIADLMLWSVTPGLGFVALILACACAARLMWVPHGDERPAWAVLILSLIPAIELVQFLSVMMAIAGLGLFCGLLITGGWTGLSRAAGAALRLLFVGPVQIGRDSALALAQAGPLNGADARSLQDWIVPGLLALTFLCLFAAANPVLDRWLAELASLQLSEVPNPGRLIFWALVATFVWPVLRLGALGGRIARPIWQLQLRQGRILTARSVMRSLVLFNALFAVQTGLDTVYLLGGAGLPEGITYAQYAHRGAYPLLATALLAGGFAILSQPWLEGRPMLRLLLLVWVGQTVVLVISSILRLQLYVSVYDLTHWRVAAFVWMALVASGLSLMIWQIGNRLPVGWTMRRSGALGLAALWMMSLTNVAGLVASHNLARDGGPFDPFYLCGLNEGAVPAIVAYQRRTGTELCYSRQPHLSTPHDWREWGYRNARLRSSVAALEGAAL